jgi:hypothetical protein
VNYKDLAAAGKKAQLNNNIKPAIVSLLKQLFYYIVLTFVRLRYYSKF